MKQLLLYSTTKWFYAIEPNESVSINSMIESRDVIFDENRVLPCKDMEEDDVILVSTPMDTSEKLMPNNGQAVSQLEYSKVIGCLMYAMTYTRSDIAFARCKLSSLKYTSYPSVLEGYTYASWISNIEDNSSTSDCVFLLDRGAISWASKKQTCITSSTMKYKYVALAAAGKEAECVATLAKAYSQMYNGKSRHLGVRHSMIRLARDLVLKSAEGMSLKSNLVTEC
ncbi:hypothetical protein Tco_0266146 [Tanacetum coccineum]